MTIGKARAIFEQLDSDKFTEAEKGEAILRVTRMETINSVTKASLLKAVKYLLELAFEICEETESEV